MKTPPKQTNFRNAVLVEFSKNEKNLSTSPNRNKKKLRANSQQSGSVRAQKKTSYSSGLINYIQSKAVYPRTARALKQEGTVVLKLTLNKTGHITQYKILTESKFNSLNLAVIKLAKELRQYKPLPRNLYPQRDFTIPVHYIIN